MKVEFTQGNKKLPKTTYILNVGTASDCPSEKLGLCDVPKECYAKKAERIYPQVEPFRKRQRAVFDDIDAQTIAQVILDKSNRSRSGKCRSFRFSEAGDFATQADVDKMAEVCSILVSNGIKCYGYTCRTDLDLYGLMDVAQVNLSNDYKRSNEYLEAGANRFKVVEKFSGSPKAVPCRADCRVCSFCSDMKGKLIEVEKH